MESFLAYPLEPQTLAADSDMRTLARFRRTMSPEDQAVLDKLLASVQHHWPVRKASAHLTPLDLLLMTMLVEQKKEINRLADLMQDHLETTRITEQNSCSKKHIQD
ncbi:MAG: hypothetical protein P8Z41_04730 [Anaerolineales bacterium]